jgi:arginyl-tRNA synthetase
MMGRVGGQVSGETLLPVQRELSALFRDALERAVGAGELALELGQLPEPVVERPRLAEHGDWATNVALTLAKPARSAPRAVAEALVRHVDTPEWVEGIEIAGPGFVNVRLAHRWFERLLRDIVAEGDRFGVTDVGKGRKVQVEFISANPTGPLHVGNARWAAVGDALANLLSATGWTVEREYYVNDAGSQADTLGASVEAAWLALAGEPAAPPEDGYRGAYIDALAAELHPARTAELLAMPAEARRAAITEFALERVLAMIRASLDRFGVHYDVWFSERGLHDSGEIERTIEDLRAHGTAYDADGAVWLRTSDYGDDKDRPLIRSNGTPTYFAADAAYWHDVRSRGFDKKIFLLGADHHGYVGRLRAIVRASGDPDDAAEIIIGQLVNLLRDGEPVRMSKRAGTTVDFDELIDEVGTDAARYTMLRTSVDAPMDFDIEAVKRQSLDNPVHYVRYAHARIRNIEREAAARGFEPVPLAGADLGRLTHPMERSLLRALAGYQEAVQVAAVLRAPYRLTRYAEDLAGAFHRFYDKCHVLSLVPDDPGLANARWWLCQATRQVLANTLGLMGVSAPDRM